MGWLCPRNICVHLRLRSFQPGRVHKWGRGNYQIQKITRSKLVNRKLRHKYHSQHQNLQTIKPSNFSPSRGLDIRLFPGYPIYDFDKYYYRKQGRYYNMTPKTISQAFESYLQTISDARSEHTHRAYANALNALAQVLADHDLPPDQTPPTDLPEDAAAWLITELKYHAPATEQLYLAAVAGFFEYLAAEKLAAPNLPRLRLLIRHRSRKTGQRLPQFPREELEKVIDYTINLISAPVELGEDGINDFDRLNQRLRNLRDRAFIVTLADTGLRVHEACKLRRGDIDWNEGRAIIIGKGDKQAVIRFSQRSLAALRDYLSARSEIDGASGKPLAALPLFARHDKGAGKKVKPITPTTGRNIVAERVEECLGGDAVGKEAIGTITPHSFRHYFVTTVLRASGNLKLAQELARHSNIAVTQRYAHLSDDELDRGYGEIFG
jgi:integrase